ncbi:hypothetical protein B0H21DRAFT_197783 [Amylocystis lapponica]|nr:hypothetical protein B0H21DRAFT_197783 [Amylocystis lapponica]
MTDPANLPLPAILEQGLAYLSSVLPPTAYNAIVTVLSHSIALLTSLFTLGGTFFSSSSWDAQTIIPPLITLLAAYLALVSFYRTTGWMIRTTFWFVKWGTILSTLVAGVGWMLGNAHANGENGLGGLFAGAGLVPVIGGFLLDMLNGQGQNAAGGQRSGSSSRSRASRSRPKTTPRPKAWESWDKHRDWQYKEDAQRQGDGGGLGAEVQKIIRDMMGTTGQAISEGRWWEAAKGAMDGLSGGVQEQEQGREERRKQPDRKAKTGSR